MAKKNNHAIVNGLKVFYAYHEDGNTIIEDMHHEVILEYPHIIEFGGNSFHDILHAYNKAKADFARMF